MLFALVLATDRSDSMFRTFVLLLSPITFILRTMPQYHVTLPFNAFRVCFSRGTNYYLPLFSLCVKRSTLKEYVLLVSQTLACTLQRLLN